MAVKANKVSLNVSGKFYIDDSCIACGACLVEAAAFIKMNNNDGYAYFFTQPTSREDEALCLEAMNTCPVESIGFDG